MADYGVPIEIEGAMAWEWASERLTSCRNFWVISVNNHSPQARPHAMPVWGVWLEQTQRFWFSCAPSAAKHRNLLHNPNVTIAVSDTVEVVTVEGIASLVSERTEDLGIAVSTAVSTYAAKYIDPALPDAAAKRAELASFMSSHAIWQVTPKRAYAIIEREEDFAAKATRWVW
jgi:Pyridoxamine 5'-phosphate oxidase